MMLHVTTMSGSKQKHVVQNGIPNRKDQVLSFILTEFNKF